MGRHGHEGRVDGPHRQQRILADRPDAPVLFIPDTDALHPPPEDLIELEPGVLQGLLEEADRHTAVGERQLGLAEQASDAFLQAA